MVNMDLTNMLSSIKLFQLIVCLPYTGHYVKCYKDNTDENGQSTYSQWKPKTNTWNTVCAIKAI